MKLWWLSFAGKGAFLGLALIEAETLDAAFEEAKRLGRHPGGQCFGVAVDPNDPDVVGLPRDRLIQEAELRARGLRKSGEMEDLGFRIDDEKVARLGGGVICEDHAP